MMGRTQTIMRTMKRNTIPSEPTGIVPNSTKTHGNIPTSTKHTEILQKPPKSTKHNYNLSELGAYRVVAGLAGPTGPPRPAGRRAVLNSTGMSSALPTISRASRTARRMDMSGTSNAAMRSRRAAGASSGVMVRARVTTSSGSSDTRASRS